MHLAPYILKAIINFTKKVYYQCHSTLPIFMSKLFYHIPINILSDTGISRA